jgi:hypothetical protein
MLEVILMPELAGGFPRRNRHPTTIPPFVGEDNSLTGLTFSDFDENRSFSTE